jgi:hypothetical protein
MWVPVTTTLQVVGMQMEETGCGELTANILNKHSRTADKGWGFSLRVGRGTKNSPLKNLTVTKCYTGRRTVCIGYVAPKEVEVVVAYFKTPQNHLSGAYEKDTINLSIF